MTSPQEKITWFSFWNLKRMTPSIIIFLIIASMLGFFAFCVIKVMWFTIVAIVILSILFFFGLIASMIC